MIFYQYLKVNDFNSLPLENYNPLLRHYNSSNGRKELFPCLFLERLEKLKKRSEKLNRGRRSKLDGKAGRV